MNTMKVIEMSGPGHLDYAERPRPQLEEHGIILRTQSVSICSTDVSYFRDHLSSHRWPIVPGHEVVGVITEVGEAMRGNYEIGQTVTYWGQTDFDGLAEYRQLYPALAQDGDRASWFTDRGFHDDFGAAVGVVPENVDSALMSLAEPLTSVLRSIYWTPPKPGDRCLVLGAGPSGLLAMQVLQRLFPTQSVEIVDQNPHRLDVAAHLGASQTIHVINGEYEELLARSLEAHGDSIDYVFDALPHDDSIAQTCNDHARPTLRSSAKAMLRPGGQYVIYGATTIQQHIDTWAILAKGLRIASAPFDVRLFPMAKTASVVQHAIDCIALGFIDVASLITHRVDFTDLPGIESIFTDYGQRNDLKTVITFNETGS